MQNVQKLIQFQRHSPHNWLLVARFLAKRLTTRQTSPSTLRCDRGIK